MRTEQRDVVRRYHDEGMSRRDVDAVVSLMTADVGWYSVDGDFERHWFNGVGEVGSFVSAMFDITETFTFHVDRLIADPDVEDVVVAEWRNEATMRDGSSYENRGCTVFVFAPGTARIREVRQYFDWGPLLERADWRASVGVLE